MSLEVSAVVVGTKTAATTDVMHVWGDETGYKTLPFTMGGPAWTVRLPLAQKCFFQNKKVIKLVLRWTRKKPS